ncbi:acyl-CoA dehydrogenase domain-containing protein [Mycolicibacterium rhodesiae JS60]|nr:acyl-CoA dehydrogenase domain-containing protein [Mycolicibacterium rhodesiae JS60]
MEIGPTSDQLDLRDAMRAVLVTECSSDLARRSYTDPDACRALWAVSQQLGWTSLASRGFGDDDLGLTTLDLALALETCGAFVAPIPMVTSVGMAAGVLRAAGHDATDLLTAIATGTVAALAVHPEDERLAGVPFSVSEGRVRGRAVAVIDAAVADMVVMLCDEDGRTVVAAVDSRHAEITATSSADPSRPMATVAVDAPVDWYAPVHSESALGAALLAAAAELVGVAQGALDIATEHACTRMQFGHPIGSYQGVKHALADCLVLVERARSLVYVAAARADDDVSPSERYLSCVLAKAAASEAALRVTQSTVQVLGALGQTWEHDAHLYLRRAWIGSAQLGDSSSLYRLAGERYLCEAAR